jgi:hypothetical protein
MSAISFQVADELKREREQQSPWGSLFGDIVGNQGASAGQPGTFDAWGEGGWADGLELDGDGGNVLDLFSGLYDGETTPGLCPRSMPEPEPYREICPMYVPPDPHAGQDYVIGATGEKVYL